MGELAKPRCATPGCRNLLTVFRSREDSPICADCENRVSNGETVLRPGTRVAMIHNVPSTPAPIYLKPVSLPREPWHEEPDP